jgi:hypothetical protein
MLKLTVLNEFPTSLLTARSDELADILSGPTLIHLPGRRSEPLFVSILLHGNEDVGLLAIQQVMREHAGHTLPRALSIFIGNVEAARQGVRRFDHQPDYNRVWPGAVNDGTPEHAMMREIVDDMRRRRVFASVDLHNNTGRNPHYSCVCRLENEHLQLASLFGHTVVYFQRPHGVQSRAFAEFCAAVTCECGKVGDANGVSHAAEFVRSCLHLAVIPTHPTAKGDIHVFHTVATVKVKSSATFGFARNLDSARLSAEGMARSIDTDASHDVTLRGDLEDLNFQELRVGTLVGTLVGDSRSSDASPLEIFDQEGRDVTDDFLEIRGRRIVLRKEVMPSMLTQHPTVIRQDCLGYFMERLTENNEGQWRPVARP